MIIDLQEYKFAVIAALITKKQMLVEGDKMNGTKGKMAEAFKELVCKKSFQKITISDIAKESAMTRENFLLSFPG